MTPFPSPDLDRSYVRNAMLLGGIFARKALAKGFCRAKFRAKFSFSRGAVWGEFFGEVWAEVFGEAFELVLLGYLEQIDFSRNFSPEFPRLCTAKLAKIQGKIS